MFLVTFALGGYKQNILETFFMGYIERGMSLRKPLFTVDRAIYDN